MYIHQISLFLQNEPGHLAPLLRTLADGGVNLITLSLADTEQFGILRLIVSDWQAARKLLEDAGRAVRVTEVVALDVPDRPGGLVEVLELLGKAGVNVDYMYAATTRNGDKATMVFRFDHPDAAIAALKKGGLALLDEAELHARRQA